MKELASQVAKKIKLAAELFREAKHPVILTGAGISTSSGIPDFRSAGTGLWAKSEAMEIASLSTFRYEPSQFYNWFRPLANSAPPKHRHTSEITFHFRARMFEKVFP